MYTSMSWEMLILNRPLLLRKAKQEHPCHSSSEKQLNFFFVRFFEKKNINWKTSDDLHLSPCVQLFRMFFADVNGGKQKKPEHNFSWKDLSYSNTHTIKCTICQGSFDSNKILFLKPIYISYIYLFGVYGSKNRHLNHNERMGRTGEEK